MYGLGVIVCYYISRLNVCNIRSLDKNGLISVHLGRKDTTHPAELNLLLCTLGVSVNNLKEE